MPPLSTLKDASGIDHSQSLLLPGRKRRRKISAVNAVSALTDAVHDIPAIHALTAWITFEAHLLVPRERPIPVDCARIVTLGELENQNPVIIEYAMQLPQRRMIVGDMREDMAGKDQIKRFGTEWQMANIAVHIGASAQVCRDILQPPRLAKPRFKAGFGR